MKTKSVTSILALLLLMTALGSGISAQMVEAFVDRKIIQLGETVDFTIKWAVPNHGIQVNLGVLKKDFKVLGTSQSNQIKMFKGQTVVTTVLVTRLQPKHTGKLEIPSFQIGQHETPPITLNVLPRHQPGQPGTRRDRFL